LTGEVPFHGDNLVAVAMKHVTEHPPSLLDQRADIPPRVAQAVERALEKDPAQRFASMDAFANELRRCRDELGGSETERTLIRGTPVVAAPLPARKPRARRRRGRLPTLLALAGLVLIGVVVAALLFGSSPIGRGNHHPGGLPAAVALKGVGDYDPQGDGSEHGYTAHLATDGNPNTYWNTERYNSRQFGGLKRGLGLVLDSGRATKLRQLTVHTATPGFTAIVQAGNSLTGPFTNDSPPQTVGTTGTFSLRGAGARYYVLWITELPPNDYVQISEMTAR
jgi:eukaryotic-like serine/threonine-protein kinase